MGELVASPSRVSTEYSPVARLAQYESLLAIFALFVLALIPRAAAMLINHFDGLYGQDAYAYYDYATEMFHSIGRGQAPSYFWWPLGYPALLSVSFLLFGVNISSAQWITVLCGAAIAPATYLLTREVSPDRYGRWGGLLAGAFIAIGGQALQSSIVIMADVPALLWATASAWLFLRFRRTKGLTSLILSALLLGMAVVTRWQNLILALVWFLTLAVLILPLIIKQFRGFQEPRRDALNLVRVSAPLWLALIVFGLTLFPQLALNTSHPAPLAGQDWFEGWSPSNFFAHSFNNVDGHFDFRLPPVIFYAQPLFHPAFLFPLLTPFFLVGAWVLARRIRFDPAPFILLVGWCTAMYLFLAGIPYENFRFGLGFFVPASVLTGIGTAWVWEELGRQSAIKSHSRTISLGLAALLAVSFAGCIYWQQRVLQPILAQKNLELAQIEWLERKLPSNATLFTFGVNGALREYTRLHIADLWDDSPQTISVHALAVAPAFLFIDKKNFDTQWQGLEPQLIFFALRDKTGLEEVGNLEGWTLFKIGN